MTRRVKPYAIYNQARKLADRHGSAAAALEAIGNVGPTATMLRGLVEAQKAVTEIHELEQALQDLRSEPASAARQREQLSTEQEITLQRSILRDINTRLLA